jgi:uncharacterized membrane protein YqjE
MEIMDNQSNKIERLSEHLIEYLDTRWDLIVLSLTNKTSRVISSLASSIILGVLALIILLFLSIAAAVWIGQRMENPAAGYLAVAGFYALLLVGVIAFARTIIRNAIVTNVIKSLNDSDENGQNS